MTAAIDTPSPVHDLSADEARRLALRAQGLLGAPDRRGGVPGLLRRLGAVQLDTISVLARSHELVPYARLGAVGRDAVESAYWGGRPPQAFEYWSHAACVLPVAEWPSFGFRRRAFRRRGRRWHDVDDAAAASVLDRLRVDGALTATDLGGAKNGGPWWDWSATKIAVEWLLDIGEVVVTERRGWRRVYDLPSRGLPEEVVGRELTDEECVRRLVRFASRALGVATVADLADYHRLRREQVETSLPYTGLVPVSVAGWRQAAWVDPELLQAPARGRHRTTLLSPFDSLVWDRRRTLRVFGFSHALEAYKPAHRREHGYFAMPLLAGGRLVGRVDPARDGRTLVARRVSLDNAKAVDALADALAEAATWVGCDSVAVQVVDPGNLASRVRKAVATRIG